MGWNSAEGLFLSKTASLPPLTLLSMMQAVRQNSSQMHLPSGSTAKPWWPMVPSLMPQEPWGLQNSAMPKLRRKHWAKLGQVNAKGSGCTEQIFTLCNILEWCTEWNRQLYINFIDYEKAFDSIHRGSLWQILEHMAFCNALLRSSNASVQT